VLKENIPIKQAKILVVGNSGVGKTQILDILTKNGNNSQISNYLDSSLGLQTFAVDIFRKQYKLKSNQLISVRLMCL
jgi:hypothetical protein